MIGGVPYLAQVRRIAPPESAGRDAELAELATFCLEPDREPYAWWRAGPGGKSASSSTFVLRPPPEVAERVRFVSFFITTRLAAQDTRQAFTEVLLGQLAALTGQELPAVLPDAIREGYLLDLLYQAAYTSQQAGERLVLVVDGLDEDRSVTTGPDAHSIAGLLPPDRGQGCGLSSRVGPTRRSPTTCPTSPAARPGHHPAPVRLPVCPGRAAVGAPGIAAAAAGHRVGARRARIADLARGGLSAADLAELAEIPLWETESILQTAVGRTFARRPARWAAGQGGRRSTCLVMKKLQAAAAGYLDGRLAGYRGRLHTWAGVLPGARLAGEYAGIPAVRVPRAADRAE